MQTNKLILATFAFASVTALTASGCTLQEANESASPAPTTGPISAQAAPAGGSPDGGGTTGSAAAPSKVNTPPMETAAAHGPGDGHDHGGGEGPTAGATTPAAPAGGAAMMPPMMGMSNPTAPLAATPALDKKIADAEKAGDKKLIGAAYAERGTARMTDDSAGPRVKYRAALDDYRKALAADPKNADATKYKKQIEDIYTSMGRPIPGA